MIKTKFILSLIIAAIILSLFIPVMTAGASDANESEMEYGKLSNISDTELLKEAAELFVSNGILRGRSVNLDGKLNIDFDANITRQEMAMFIGRIKSGNPAMFVYNPNNQWHLQQRFKDVTNPEFSIAINYCDDMNIIKAKDPDNQLYDSEGPVTIQEAVEIILTALGYTNLSEKEKIEIKSLKRGECLMFVGDDHILTKVLAADFEEECLI